MARETEEEVQMYSERKRRIVIVMSQWPWAYVLGKGGPGEGCWDGGGTSGCCAGLAAGGIATAGGAENLRQRPAKVK